MRRQARLVIGICKMQEKSSTKTLGAYISRDSEAERSPMDVERDLEQNLAPI